MDGAAEGAAGAAGGGGGMSHKECVDGINKSLEHPTVKFLREKMEKAGCPVWPRLLTAITCKGQSSAGGYSSGRGGFLLLHVFCKFQKYTIDKGTLRLVLSITICCNHMTFQDEINQVIIHELIHAYDDCRAKNMEWTNCAHHACSEIRANHLSGDCHYKRELLRGFLKIRGHGQECVRRRALKSVQNNPYCSAVAAKDAIEAVWDICYNDTSPFDRAP
ncbi:Peptidase M76 family [Musa troglodytarum]|uniref:Mitochondrial inner membrane protease ATP23 n=1 Tax=Musa troglodytarum TaxID=320322 RepID=A0A9E7H9Q0_9LILI|nr:Peptidase M76 family [Musa troglodytarum]